jgi:hypothetical protein
LSGEKASEGPYSLERKRAGLHLGEGASRVVRMATTEGDWSGHEKVSGQNRKMPSRRGDSLERAEDGMAKTHREKRKSEYSPMSLWLSLGGENKLNQCS